MKLKVSLCQVRPTFGDPETNADVVCDIIEKEGCDICILPESYLTGYGFPLDNMEMRIVTAIATLEDYCRERNVAVATGAPLRTEKGWTNCLIFISPEGTSVYEKAHLARFGIYAENEFTPGMKPAMGFFRGLRFGLSICYDIYFPEILHGYSLRGADMNICVSAAAKPSAPYFDKVLPARALENVTYLAFVNNIGEMNGLEMAGTSCAYTPLGDKIVSCGTEENIASFHLDTDEIHRARCIRRHLDDYRSDIEWL